jgi:hypothetical protein
VLAEYKKKTNIGMGLGIVAQFVGVVLINSGYVGTVFGYSFLLGGIVLCIWGCWSYAKGKGYDGVLGFLGLFTIIGLIILACLPDKHK